MTTKLIAVILVTFGMLQVSAQDTTFYLSLKESCQLGIDKNVNTLNAELEKQRANYELREARSKLYPQVEAYSTFSYYYAIPKMVIPGEIFGQTGMMAVEIGTKYDWASGFKASQVLYNQSYFTSLKVAQRMESISGLTLQQKKEEIIYQVSQIYYLCQATNYQASQLKTTLKNTDSLLVIARLQSENGIIRKVDYSRVSVNKANLQTQIDNLDQLYNQQMGMLKYLIGIDITAKVELSDSLSFFSTETATLPDFNKRVELQIIDNQLESISLARRMNQQSYLPTLTGFGQYYYEGQRNEFDFFEGGNDKFYQVGLVGLSLNIPIFDGFEKHCKTQQKDIELQQLQNTRKSTSDFLSKEFADALRQYENSQNALLRQRENIKLAEETYSISLEGYSQQTVPLSDLLMSESSLIEARLSYYNALLQLKNAELDVKKAKGELLNQ